MIKARLREILEERKFSYDECLIDSLMRIDEEDIEYCKECYYFVWDKTEDGIRVCTQDINVNEVR